MSSDDQVVSSTYACRCLNIRITTTLTPSERPNYPSDPNYSPAFVNDDGIQVNHPQATVRLMSKPVPVPGTSKHSRFTTLTCLFCALPAYRVYHVISLDIEGNSTTFLPSEEWVEKEVLKSATGWIDVHKDCLTTDHVAKALAAPSYISLFGMTMLRTPSFPPSPESDGDSDSSSEEEDDNNKAYLPKMRPVFLPPPFTPSNQVFVHLADVADKQSQILRSEAEERIQIFIKAEAAEILEKERIIKSQVLCFWKEFKQHLGALKLDITQRKARSPTRLEDQTSTNGLISARGIPSSVAVRCFAPAPLSSSVRHATSPPQPRVSALSASLATSTFHHPKECRGRSTEHMSPVSSDDETTDSGSASSTFAQTTTGQGEEANVLQFRRTINDDINTQASYRYFVNLEGDMERFKRAKKANSRREIDQHERVPPAEVNTHQLQATVSEAKPQKDTSPPRGRDKGKRKVTFDVKPVIVALENDVKAPEGLVTSDQETIFRLDDMVPNEGTEVPVDDTQNTLPLLEQPPPRPITIKRRSLNAGSEVFQSLRPTSLPAPSHVRPVRSPPGVDSSHGMLAPFTKVVPKGTRLAPSLNENEKQLVAVDTPSHKGTWTPSDDWNMATGKGSREDTEDTIEEDESDEDQTAQSTPVAFPIKVLATNKMEDLSLNTDPHMIGSLPIKIKKLVPPKPLSLASYVGQDMHCETAELAAPSTINGKKQSSGSIRKAAYLEKDRARAIDPGPLDSVVEDDEVEDDDSDISDAQDEGEKARAQALRILQARSELPEEGMWRSLA